MQFQPKIERRGVFALGAGVLCGQQANAAAKPVHAKYTFVLVHGSFLGGWCWTEVARILRSHGHEVYAPTLTGLGERSHLRRSDVDLSTHIADVVNTIQWQNLKDIVLVGHSYGGTVITGVCDILKDRIRHVVYLDSGIARDGETNIPGATRESIEGFFGPLEDGYLIPPMPLDNFGLRHDRVSKHVLKWFKARLTPQPIKTYLEPLCLQNDGAAALPKTYILCTADRSQPYGKQLKALLKRVQRPGWRFIELRSGHNAMTLAPRALSKLLEDSAM